MMLQINICYYSYKKLRIHTHTYAYCSSFKSNSIFLIANLSSIVRTNCNNFNFFGECLHIEKYLPFVFATMSTCDCSNQHHSITSYLVWFNFDSTLLCCSVVCLIFFLFYGALRMNLFAYTTHKLVRE